MGGGGRGIGKRGWRRVGGMSEDEKEKKSGREEVFVSLFLLLLLSLSLSSLPSRSLFPNGEEKEL